MTDQPTEVRKRLGWVFWVCLAWITLFILLAIFANVLPFQNPDYQNSTLTNLGPSFAHWLGTDALGRDILSRLVFGSRVSIIVGFGSIAIGMAIGGTAGLISGYLRGWVDTTVNAVSYMLLAFPALVAVIAIVSFWGSTLWKITLILGVFSSPLIYRIIRASTLSYATRDFVAASRSLGAPTHRILIREILPNILPTVISFGLIGVATVIVLEGSLSFLGLSVKTPTPSWGNMLNASVTGLLPGANSNPSLVIFPAMAMFLFLLALNLMGDRLRNYFDVTEVKL